MTSSTLGRPTCRLPAGKSMPMTDIAPRQCGHIVAATASVASHSRCAHVPQPRQTRSKFIPRLELTGTYFIPRSTRVQRPPERQLAPEMQENRGNSRNLPRAVPQQIREPVLVNALQKCTEDGADVVDPAQVPDRLHG